MNADDDRDARLLNDVAAGGARRRVALGTLYRAHQPGFERALGRHLVSREEIADITHNAWERIAGAVWRPDSQVPPAAWLYKVLEHTRLDWLRARRRHGSRLDSMSDEAVADRAAAHASDDLVPEARLALLQLAACIEAAYAKFEQDRPRHAQTLSLIEDRDLSIDQVAAILGRSRHGTEVFLSEARQHFRQLVAKCFDRKP